MRLIPSYLKATRHPALAATCQVTDGWRSNAAGGEGGIFRRSTTTKGFSVLLRPSVGVYNYLLLITASPFAGVRSIVSARTDHSRHSIRSRLSRDLTRFHSPQI